LHVNTRSQTNTTQKTAKDTAELPAKTSKIELVHLEIVGNLAQIFGHAIIDISLNHSQNPFIAYAMTW